MKLKLPSETLKQYNHITLLLWPCFFFFSFTFLFLLNAILSLTRCVVFFYLKKQKKNLLFSTNIRNFVSSSVLYTCLSKEIVLNLRACLKFSSICWFLLRSILECPLFSTCGSVHAFPLSVLTSNVNVRIKTTVIRSPVRKPTTTYIFFLVIAAFFKTIFL